MITEEMLEDLRQRVYSSLSERRYTHTLGVEKMALYLAEHCLPQKAREISAAALLHDITKELPIDTQFSILEKAGVKLEDGENFAPAVVHSFTAPYVVKKDFPDFATDEILSAISKHTLGDVNMSVFDRIIFLADFIEETRTYPDSRATARFVLNSMKPGAIKENIIILNRACVMEFDSTISHLSKIGKSVDKKSVLARASLLSKI